MTVIIRRIRNTKRRARFLRELARDLGFLGRTLTIRQQGSALHLRLSLRRQTDFVRQHRRIHRATLWNSRAEIRALERQIGLELSFADPNSVCAQSIRPQIELCKTERELAIFDYLRRYQTVPSNPCVGATLKALVYDHGQGDRPKIIGILALASAKYFQGARDEYLGWANPQTGYEARALRERGLKGCLHVATCMVVPPYDGLRCGRILAMMCFSDVLQDAFRKKYGYGYVALTAGASLQNYAVVYDRLHLAQLVAASGRPHLYAKLRGGQPTYALLTGAISSRTFSAASRLASRRVHLTSKRARTHALSFALADCGLNLSIFRANRTATYLGTTSNEYIEFLRTGKQPSIVQTLTIESIMSYWRGRFLKGALQQLELGHLRSAAVLSRGLRSPYRTR